MQAGVRHRHLPRFLLATAAVSLLTGLPLLMVGWRTSNGFTVGLISVLGACVPAWSMIAGAVGAPLQRKATYLCGLLLVAVTFDLLAFMTGWQALAMTATTVSGAGTGTAIAAYQLILLACPVLALVFFAGKRPAVFWESDRN